MLLLNTTLNSSITYNITTNWSLCEHLWRNKLKDLATDVSPSEREEDEETGRLIPVKGPSALCVSGELRL